MDNLLDPLNVVLINNIYDAIDEAEEEVEGLNDFVDYFVDPLNALSDLQFKKKFRLTKNLTRDLIEMIRPNMRPALKTFALSVERRVLIALRFFAAGSYQEITGTNVFCGVSQPSVSRAIREVSEALNIPEIFNHWVHFPRNVNELNVIQQRFYQKYQFPGIIGCLDCTHVAIIRPVNNDNVEEFVYVNRKMYHSINVQLICDDQLRILNVNARYPGSVHDARIWRESTVSTAMENLHQLHPNRYFLLGDSGYPLRPWLLTPFTNPVAGSPQERYNNAQTSIRSTIERCNGVLKNRFRCLLKHRVLHYSPTVASNIINACVVLHNMCVNYRIELELEDHENEIIDMGELGAVDLNDFQYGNNRRVPNVDLEAGNNLRNHIVRNYFWQ